MWILLALFFAFVTAIRIFTIKKLSSTTNTSVILFGLNTFIIAWLCLVLLLTSGIPQINSHFILLTICFSLLDTAAFMLWVKAITLSDISLISPLQAFNPIFTTILVAITLHDSPTPEKWLGIILIVFGAYLLNVMSTKEDVLKPFKVLYTHKGVRYFLISNVILALTPILQKQAIAQTSTHSALFTSFSGILLMNLFLTPFMLKHAKTKLRTIKSNLWIYVVVGLLAGLAQWAAFTAFSLTNPGYVTAVTRLSILFGILIGALFLHEKNIKERLAGSVVMLAGVILLAI